MQNTTTTVGRHRLGTPGLVHISTLVRVVRRGLLRSLFVPGRHRRAVPVRAADSRRVALPATV